LFTAGSYTRLATSATFSVTATAPSVTQTTLGVTPTSVPAGSSVTAIWSGIAAPASTDWIGLYAPGAAAGTELAWSYVSCSQTPGTATASGSCAFPIPGTVALGTYELRLFTAGSYTRLATSATFSVTATAPSVTQTTLGVTPSSVPPGSSVTVTWSGIAAPTSTGWIGLYGPATAAGPQLAGVYVSCSQTPGTAKASGSCAGPIPGTVAPGPYELRLFTAGSYTRLATSATFSVTATAPSVTQTTLGATPTTVPAG